MEYEIVDQKGMEAAGLMVRINNSSPDVGEKIGGLWKTFFEGGIYDQIPDKADGKSIGLYTNYLSDQDGDYDAYVCCLVKEGTRVSEPLKTVKISAGRYARFIVKGNMVTAVQEFWTKLWEMNLDRKYDCDYEEYQPQSGDDRNHCEIHMYISLNE